MSTLTGAAAAACWIAGPAAAPASAQNLTPIPLQLTDLLPQVPKLFTPAGEVVPGVVDQHSGVAGTDEYDRGLYVHYCPDSGDPQAAASHTSWAGWPAKECLKMDKGPAGKSHVLVGLDNVHNWLLGGYGNDTIIGGNHGDVIWADYHPAGWKFQVAMIHAGNGRNVIYANDTRNYVWTGTNPKTVVHAHGPGTSGVIHCQSPGIIVFMSRASHHNFKLPGCRRISYFSVGY